MPRKRVHTEELLERNPSLAIYEKTKQVVVRVSEQDYNEIVKIAIKRDLSISQLIRTAINNELGFPTETYSRDNRKTAWRLKPLAGLLTVLFAPFAF